MRAPSPWSVLLVALALLALAVIGSRYEALFDAARERELAATQRAWQAQRARLLKSAQILEARAEKSERLAAARPRVVVRIPAVDSLRVPVSQPIPSDTGIRTSAAMDTLAAVTINDTSYAVPVRVAVVVDSLLVELAHADSLRAAADTVLRQIPITVVAADSVITVATKKRPWFVRWLGKAKTALCAAGGAFLGSLAGNEGAAVGAAGGVAICAVAR
jgi:hypothetical protein